MAKTTANRDRDGDGVYPCALHVDSEGHGHCAEHDERASQQQAQAHVEAVLHLIYIIREAGYHRIRAELVQFRKRKALDMVKDG